MRVFLCVQSVCVRASARKWDVIHWTHPLTFALWNVPYWWQLWMEWRKPFILHTKKIIWQLKALTFYTKLLLFSHGNISGIPFNLLFSSCVFSSSDGSDLDTVSHGSLDSANDSAERTSIDTDFTKMDSSDDGFSTGMKSWLFLLVSPVFSALTSAFYTHGCCLFCLSFVKHLHNMIIINIFFYNVTLSSLPFCWSWDEHIRKCFFLLSYFRWPVRPGLWFTV